MSEVLRYAGDERGVVTLTLDRPEARNAFNLALAEALALACRRATEDGAKLVLLRAAGPVFCAGADLKERQGMSDEQVRARRLRGFLAYAAIEALPMPSIAVVAGPAVGSGVEIAAACDFILATPAASFRTPEALWGTVGATQRLPRVLGARLAKDMMFTGRTLSAEEALAHGLVSRLVAPEALEATVEEIAATIAKAPPAAMRMAKRCIAEGLDRDPRGALATELLALEENLAAAEWKKAMAAFGKG
ncbi:enoyl-CoA hydratase/isomerase family protein [Siccirubricoccus sp. KC 17139]|uniref:Enoyl-CoA hydratase/isomerase family protein n=1 Tax=Siccirubricoccus soli TaxID=2899147 RepID=A0ABT1D157_9PROT|nr:enoyl-CoA hydratase/isomerase family protein [Siccirubricoccus soli]MCO6415643.1 enoyl-CoA hydratase/isomerase family protein [Siccirubricoccus soli]MCP2681775.1 enoyl-CoA hydratase/isomerase family protein [Siccirubricoccus soli]